MSSDERRRQLVGLGLKALTERPIHEVSLDDVTAEAGISRGLLFHYFPTKAAFYEEVVAAAGRRVARTVRPDDGVTGRAAIDQFLERWIAQIERRRALYVALVRGNLADLGGQEVAGSLWERMTSMVVGALAQAGGSAEPEHREDHAEPVAVSAGTTAVVHAWLAYVEDLALTASLDRSDGGDAREVTDRTELVQHCHRALDQLIALEPPRDITR